MRRPLGRAAFVVYAPFRLTVVRLHSTLAWSLAKAVMQRSDSAFRVWRILGGGKIRQTLCVLFLAKILLNYSFYFILAAAACPPSAEKIYKRCFCSVSSAPASRFIKNLLAGKPNLSWKRWLVTPR